MVRLVEESNYLKGLSNWSFNSLMVRLVDMTTAKNNRLIMFQFLDGAIGSPGPCGCRPVFFVFQFLDGAIGRVLSNGTIKTNN